MMRRWFVLSVLALTWAAPAVAEDEAKVKTTPVGGAVYMIEGKGGNIGVSVGSDGVLLVDDQMAVVLDEIRAAVKNLNKGRLRFVLNTHFHGDHTGNNAALASEATIIAHAKTRERLITPQELAGETREPIDPAGWPVITFDQSVSLHFNGEEVKVMHLPNGHTDGDAVVLFTQSKVLHIGDLLFSGLFPYVDLDHGGTLDGYVANLETLLASLPADVKIIPGHGPLSTIDDVRASRDMIVETSAIVRDKMKEGLSLEDLQREGLPERFASFDWNFISTDRWIETIWRAYKEQKG